MMRPPQLRHQFRNFTTTVETSAKKDNGIPWFLIAPVGFVGSVIAYFYRGNKNGKLELAFKDTLKDDLFMSPEEMVLLRESNKLTIPIFKELAKRAEITFPPNRMDCSVFLNQFCMDQLGGNFQANGRFKNSHVFERLEKKIGKELDLDLALCILSLTVFGEPEEVIKSLFQVLNKGETEMSYDKFEHVLDLLEKTNQLPVRVLIKTENHYPFNIFTKKQIPELAEAGLAALDPDTKAPGGAEFIKNRKMKPMREDEFVHVLLSKNVCVWGACWQVKKT